MTLLQGLNRAQTTLSQKGEHLLKRYRSASWNQRTGMHLYHMKDSKGCQPSGCLLPLLSVFFFPLCFLFFSVLLCIYFLSIGCWHCLYGFGMTFCLALFFPGGPAEPISAPNFPFTVWTVKMDLGPSICFLCPLVSCYALSVEGARETLQEGQSFISWFSSACLATS